MSVPSRNYPGKYAHAYLVTAKHVAVHLQRRDFVITLNDRNNTGGILINVPAQHANWWMHPTDNQVDVAVKGWPSQGSSVDPKIIPSSMFLTKEIIHRTGIGAGDEVFIAGLFVHLKDTEKNLPIVRTGNIALIADEPIPTALGRTEAYLIEARSLGGLSGSPSFVHPSAENTFYLLGLMHGHWDIPIEERDAPMFQDEAENGGKVNMGIAIVVPAEKILEVLNQPELITQRDEADERMEQKHAAIPDTAFDISI